MPSKFNADDPETAAQIAAFRSIGLNDAKSLEVARSSKQAAILASLIDRAQLREKRETGDLDEKKLALLLSLCVASAKLDEQSKLYALDAILRGRLKSNEQTSGVVVSILLFNTYAVLLTASRSAAVKYLEANPPPVDANRFDSACGVGEQY